MTPTEAISLYQCNDCRKQTFDDRIGAGLGCARCGSRYVRNAPPTFRYIAGYLLHYPRLIPRFIKENVLGLS